MFHSHYVEANAVPVTVYSPVVTIGTASITFTILRSAHTVYLCVLCGSGNKQRLFPYTALTDWFVLQRRRVCTAPYELGLCIYLLTYSMVQSPS